MKIPNRHRLPVNEFRVCCIIRDLILFLFAVNKSAPSICGNEISPLAVVHREKFPRGETFRLRNPQKFVPRGIFAETKQSGIWNETLRRRKVYWNVMRGGPMIILSEIHIFTRQRGWVTKLWFRQVGWLAGSRWETFSSRQNFQLWSGPLGGGQRGILMNKTMPSSSWISSY